MKKYLLIVATTVLGHCAFAQNTTYGNGAENAVFTGIQTNDNSPDSTTVVPGGVVLLQSNSNYTHSNTRLSVSGVWNALSGSMDSFVAAGSNTISGSVAPDFFNASFNGLTQTMAITGTQGININNNLSFNNNITTTIRNRFQQGSLHFLTGAGYNGNLSDNCHVNGYVHKQGNAAFSFPVGSGTDYRSLAISAPVNNASISVAWLAGNPGFTTATFDGLNHPTTSLGEGVSAVNIRGQWDLISQVPATNSLSITASMPDLTGFAQLNDIRIVGWNGTAWVNLSKGNYTISGSTENSLITGTLPAGGGGITALGFGSIRLALPRINDFSGILFNCKAILLWTTPTDINGDHHEVEFSVDGTNFHKIATVASASTVPGNVYHYTDSILTDGTNYFRIKIVNTDGQFIYSTVQSFVNHCVIVKHVFAYPNPARDYVIVTGLTGVNKISVTNNIGSKMMAVMVNDGISGKQRIDVSSLPQGLYFIHVVNAYNAVTNIKILIQ